MVEVHQVAAVGVTSSGLLDGGRTRRGLEVALGCIGFNGRHGMRLSLCSD